MKRKEWNLLHPHTLSAPQKILICGSDPDFIKILVQVLEKTGYSVDSCATDEQALTMSKSTPYNLILLDEELADICGLQLLKQLREFSQVPIIILSANSQKENRLVAFSWGADDYLLKPFCLNELEARVEAAIRRYTIYNKSPQVLSLGNIQIDLESKIVTKDGQAIKLYSKEYETLLLLIEHEDQILTPKQIYEAVWKEPYPYSTNAVATTIWRIRNKLENNSSHPVIQTIKGIGYRLIE